MYSHIPQNAIIEGIINVRIFECSFCAIKHMHESKQSEFLDE